MSVPGSNLLYSALALIAPQTVRYFKCASRQLNEIGYYVSTFELGIDVGDCSVQAVNRSKYAALGFDLKKNYVELFIQEGIISLDRGDGGDQFEWNGRRYQMINDNDWYVLDGWAYTIAVDIGPIVVPSALAYDTPGLGYDMPGIGYD